MTLVTAENDPAEIIVNSVPGDRAENPLSLLGQPVVFLNGADQQGTACMPRQRVEAALINHDDIHGSPVRLLPPELRAVVIEVPCVGTDRRLKDLGNGVA